MIHDVIFSKTLHCVNVLCHGSKAPFKAAALLSSYLWHLELSWVSVFFHECFYVMLSTYTTTS